MGNEPASSVPLHFHGRILISWYTQEQGEAVSPYATALGVTGPHDGDVLLGPYVEIQNRHFKAQTCQGTQGQNQSTSKQNVKVSGRPGFKNKIFKKIKIKPAIKLSMTDYTSSSQLFITR